MTDTKAEIYSDIVTPYYFTMMPNMAFDDLSPVAYKLLAVYMDCTNRNLIYATNRNLAKKLGVSVGTMKKYRTELADKGYITVEDGKSGEDTKTARITIQARWIWAENERRMSEKVSKTDGGVSNSNSPLLKSNTHKQELNKQELKEKDIAPDKSDAIEAPSKPKKQKKRDILFDGILATAFRINPIEATAEQLEAAAGRVGKIKRRLIKINPAFKEMDDDAIRAELKSFWAWYKKQYTFDEAHLRSDSKWGEYYLEYHLRDKNPKQSESPSQSTLDRMKAEQERLNQLQGDKS